MLEGIDKSEYSKTWNYKYLLLAKSLESHPKLIFTKEERLKVQMKLIELMTLVSQHPKFKESIYTETEIGIPLFFKLIKEERDINSQLRNHYETLKQANNKLNKTTLDKTKEWGGIVAIITGGYAFLCELVLGPIFGFPCIGISEQFINRNWGELLLIVFGLILYKWNYLFKRKQE